MALLDCNLGFTGILETARAECVAIAESETRRKLLEVPIDF